MMKKTDLKGLRTRDRREDIGEFDSLLLIPTRRKHDSGYRCMDFVAMKDNKPICFLSGCSDVLHIGGISGNDKVWNIDLLPCGYFRLFPRMGKGITCGPALSSFEVF